MGTVRSSGGKPELLFGQRSLSVFYLLCRVILFLSVCSIDSSKKKSGSGNSDFFSISDEKCSQKDHVAGQPVAQDGQSLLYMILHRIHADSKL